MECFVHKDETFCCGGLLFCPEAAIPKVLQSMNRSLMRISANQHELGSFCFADSCIVATDCDGYSANWDYIDAEIVSNENQELPAVVATPVCRVRGAYSDSQSRIVSGIFVDLYV